MQTSENPNVVIHNLPNGRIYKVTDTRRPYIDGEYPDGGFHIAALLEHSKEWSFIDYSPNQQCVDNFLKAAARLPVRTH